MDLELQELELPVLGQDHQPGSMHKITKNRFLGVSLVALSIFGGLFSFFLWWVQTTVEIGNLDRKFNAETIIHEVEIQSDGYTVRGMKNVFKSDQNKKISKISLKQGTSRIRDGLNTNTYDTVFVHVWKSGKPNDWIMYSCRFYDADVLTVARVLLEGSQ